MNNLHIKNKAEESWQPLGPLLKVKLLVGHMKKLTTVNSKQLRE